MRAESEALHKAKLAMSAQAQTEAGGKAAEGLLDVAVVHAWIATAAALEKIAGLLEPR